MSLHYLVKCTTFSSDSRYAAFIKTLMALKKASCGLAVVALKTRGSAIAEEPRDALRQLKYYGRFLTELLTRSSANPEEPCEHIVS